MVYMFLLTELWYNIITLLMSAVHCIQTATNHFCIQSVPLKAMSSCRHTRWRQLCTKRL